MGRVMAKMKLTNHIDSENAVSGVISPDEVRSVEVEGLVDTGATMLVLPSDIVAELGIRHRGTRPVRYADGRIAHVPWVGGVQIEILGREMTCDALVEAEGTAPLIGQIPLEGLDLIVDPKSREVKVNPESPDAPLMEALAS